MPIDRALEPLAALQDLRDLLPAKRRSYVEGLIDALYLAPKRWVVWLAHAEASRNKVTLDLPPGGRPQGRLARTPVALADLLAAFGDHFDASHIEALCDLARFRVPVFGLAQKLALDWLSYNFASHGLRARLEVWASSHQLSPELMAVRRQEAMERQASESEVLHA